MSKVLLIMGILLSLALPLVAEAQQPAQPAPAQAVTPLTNSDQPQMNTEQKREFEQKKLYVDQGVLALSAGFSPMSNSHLWEGRQGFVTVSEANFYQIAGLPELAGQASQYRTLAWTLTVGGVALELAGDTVMSLALISSQNDYSTAGQTNGLIEVSVGAVMTLVAIIPIVVGIKRLRQNWSPADEARQAADDYNAKLVTIVQDKSQQN